MTTTSIQDARAQLAGSLSKISQFWGLPRAMGAIYGVVYLAREPISLEDLAKEAGVTKGAASIHIRALERLGMVHQEIRVGERKDYYIAETDFWKITKGILEQRRRTEFDSALRSVNGILDSVKTASWKSSDTKDAAFCRDRLQAMVDFFRTIDSVVATLLELDKLRAGGLQWLTGKGKRSKS